MTRFISSLRRELWECRWVYLAPAVAAAVFTIGYFLSAFVLLRQLHSGVALTVAERDAFTQPFVMVEGLLMLAGLIVGVIYCLDALYGERRDRSVLFWKSMPVSDVVTVLAKASVPIVVLPLVIFVVTVISQALMLLASWVVLSATGQAATPVLSEFSLVSNSGALLFHLLAVHGLAAAPVFAWLLMVSAWAPRAPFVWAVVPPVIVLFIERMAFRTTHLAAQFLGTFTPGVAGAAGSDAMMEPMTAGAVAHFATSGGLWLGLAVTAAFLAAAA
ncbi:MAG: ABC transporter permease, partial [Gemmatimonadaceae bacterium]